MDLPFDSSASFLDSSIARSQSFGPADEELGFSHSDGGVKMWGSQEHQCQLSQSCGVGGREQDGFAGGGQRLFFHAALNKFGYRYR